MTTQMIDVPDLPEGWEAVAYGWPKKDIDYVFDGIGVKLFIGKEEHAMMIVEKIQFLANEEPKLRLSVDEWNLIISYLFKSDIDRLLFGKLRKFIKETS